MTTTTKVCPECGEQVWDVSTVDQALNKCWKCGQRWMDDPDDAAYCLYCPKCDAELTQTDLDAEECTQCGKDLSKPRRVKCSYPGCTRLTTIDRTYGDLCYEHIRADNE